MFEQIAEHLLIHVFYRVSAVVVVEDMKRTDGITIFDTEFGGAYAAVPARAQEIWLISNHPEGQTLPYAADWENVEHLRRRAPKARIRLFICGEDIGCIEHQVAV